MKDGKDVSAKDVPVEDVSGERTVQVNAETFECPNCGGVMGFDIKAQRFVCAACKTEGEIETLVNATREYDFRGYLEREQNTVPFEGMAVVTCQNCGASITFEERQVAATCPMCSSTQIAAVKQKAGIPPEGVVPFKIDRQDAQEKFKRWVKSRWFAPNDFKKTYGEGKLSGVYLPFWTFDANAVASYSGQGGIVRSETDSKGNTTTRTDWYPVSGVVRSSFDDVQVYASDREAHVSGILPYGTTHNLVPYSMAYLSGYFAEVYKIKADAGFELAKGVMEERLKSLAEADIRRRYDVARVTSLLAKYTDVTYKHVLLPAWSSAFGYKGKTYSYIVNGETGKVAGGRPYSVPKIVAAVLAAIVAVTLIVTLTREDGEFATAGYNVSAPVEVCVPLPLDGERTVIAAEFEEEMA